MSLIQNLKLNLDQFCLDIPNLEIPDEGIITIQGPSGSGKTTFLKTLIGIHNPNNWSWIFKDIEMSKLNMSDRRLGVVFQNYDLFPNLSVFENINIVMKARLNADQYIKNNEKLNHYKAVLGLEKIWLNPAQTISGGEKQRVALLRAVLSDARLILLDEPFSALDTELKHEARELTKKIIYENNIPVWLVTHDESDIKALSSCNIIFKNGSAAVSK